MFLIISTAQLAQPATGTIEIIPKNLTKKYELWGPEWDKKVDRVSDHISMNDIRSIRGEIKRIYRKL